VAQVKAIACEPPREYGLPITLGSTHATGQSVFYVRG
jgi:hypothetical protein